MDDVKRVSTAGSSHKRTAFLIAMILAALLAVIGLKAAWAANDVSWEGTGTKNDPYLISSAEDLQQLATLVNDNTGNYYSRYYKLTNDIDLSTLGGTWTPIAGGNYPTNQYNQISFSGTFDGDYHTISGLNVSMYRERLGLFGMTNGAEISNLTVEGAVKNTGSGSYVGGLVGYDNGSTYKNVVVNVDVTSGGDYVGGFTGYGYNTKSLDGCASYGDVSGGSRYVGGLIGYLNPYNSTPIKNCYNRGDVTGTSGMVGGLIGYVSCSTYRPFVLENSYSTGALSGAAASTGSIVGTAPTSSEAWSASQITNCYGIEGVNLFGTGLRNATSSADASTKTDAEMKAAAFAATLGDAFMASSNDYPVFKWMTPADMPTFTAQPESFTYPVGEASTAHTMTAKAELPEGIDLEDTSLHYVWYKTADANFDEETAEVVQDGSAAVEPDGTSYTVPSDLPVGTYCYWVKATNSKGTSALSEMATVRIWSGNKAATPVVTTESATENTVFQAHDLELSVSASTVDEAGELTYQWYRVNADGDDVAMEGATEATFAVPTENMGTEKYYCTVTNTLEVAENTASANSVTFEVQVTGYQIDTVDDFIAFAKRVNGADGAAADSFAGCTVFLSSDLDLSSATEAVPVAGASSDTPFSGIFAGQGHTITLGIDDTTSTGAVALFGYVAAGDGVPVKAQVTNLVLKGSVKASGMQTAALAANAANAAISMIGNEATVASSGVGTNYTGGIVGHATGSVVLEECYNRAAVTSSGSCAGGLVGATVATSLEINNCYATGAVTSAGAVGYESGTGALVGYKGGSYSSTIKATNSYAAAPVSSATSSVSADFGSGYPTMGYTYYVSEVAEASGISGASTSISAYDLRQMVAATDSGLNSKDAYAYDNYSVNGGYPILKWESELTSGDYAAYPKITDQSDGAVAVVNSAVELSVTAEAPQGATLSYQWYEASDAAGTGEKAVPEASGTSAKLTLDTATPKTSYYRCVVTAAAAGQTKTVSTAAVKVILYPVAIAPTVSVSSSVAQGEDGVVSVNQGDELKLSAEASSSQENSELSYQWYRATFKDGEGERCASGTSATYTVSTSEISEDAVYYYCEVTSKVIGADNVATTKSDAIGVVVNPIIIKTADELADFAAKVNAGTDYSGVTITIGNDIDLADLSEGKTFHAIGLSSRYSFSGTFDGGDHTITLNLTSDNASGDYLGLFGYVYGSYSSTATIKNLNVAGSVSGATRYTSAVAAYVDGYVSLEKVASMASVSNAYTENTSPATGGLAGYVNTSLTLRSGCFNTGDVSGGNYTGGIVGYASSSFGATSVYNTGDVSGGNNTGGLVGYVSSSFRPTGCYNTGDVSGAIKTGGLVGETRSDFTISSCYDTGAVSGGNYTGGLIGYVYNYSSWSTYRVSYSYVAAPISAVAGAKCHADFGEVYSSYSSSSLPSCSGVYYAEDLTGASGIESTTGSVLVNAVSASELRALGAKDSEGLNATGNNTGKFFYDSYTINGGYPVLEWQMSAIQEAYAAYPKITSQSDGATVRVGGTVELTVSAEAPEGATLAYQWYVASDAAGSDAKAVSEASGTDTKLVVDTSASKEGYYFCTATATADSASHSTSSAPVKVLVYSNAAAPTVESVTPSAAAGEDGIVSVTQGDALTLTVNASSDQAGSELSYQWYKATSKDGEGQACTGLEATERTYTVDTSKITEEGDDPAYYYCVVTNTVVDEDNAASAVSGRVQVAVNPLVISTANEFAKFADNVNAGATYRDVTVYLGNDIDMGNLSIGKEFHAAGSFGGSSFAGTFDGQGHSITLNLTDDNASGDCLGLFGYIAGTSSSTAGVKNLVLKGSVAGSVKYIGALSGRVNTYVTIENVGVDASVSSTNSDYSTSAGGLVGYANSNVTFKGCYNHGTVTSEAYYTGGLLGYMSSYPLVINDSYNTGTISGSYNVGGVVGYISYTYGGTNVARTYSAGAVSGTGTYYLYSDFGYGSPSTSSSYYDGEATGRSSRRFTSATTDDLKNLESSVGEGLNANSMFSGDKAGDEAINGGYPVLTWELNTPESDPEPAPDVTYELALNKAQFDYSGAALDLAGDAKVVLDGDTEIASDLYELAFFTDEACTAPVDADKVVDAGTYYVKALIGSSEAANRPETNVVAVTIGKATLTATYAGESVAWGAVPALSVEVEGFVNGETPETAAGYVAPKVSAPEALEGGKSYELVPAGGSADNYEFAYVGGTLEVGLHPVAVPAAAEGLIYSGTEQTGVVAAEGYEVEGGAATAAGSYEATATLAEGYSWVDGSADPVVVPWSIAAKAVSVEAPSLSKIYGEADPEIVATVTGVVEGEELSFTLDRKAGENVGTYDIDVVLGENPNYEVTATAGAIVIGKATLTATYAGESVAWGAAPALSVEVEGFVNGETPETAAGYVAPKVSAPEALEGGKSYELVPAGGSADNYEFAYVGGTLEVGAVPATPADKEKLASAIAAADELLGAVDVSDDGTDVPANMRWSTSDDRAKLESVVASGREVLADEGASLDKVNELTDAVNAAKEAFEAALKDGLRFTDVDYTGSTNLGWAAPWITDAARAGLMTGFRNPVTHELTGEFMPADGLTRAQAIVVIYRAATGASSDEAFGVGTAGFTDVAESDYYTNALIWAKANGIVTGYDGTSLFMPDSTISRQEIALLIWRVCGCPAATDGGAAYAACTDAGFEWDSATEALKWTASENILSGFVEPEGLFLDPFAGTQRCQAAKIFSQSADFIAGLK